MIENIYFEMYLLLIDIYIREREEWNCLFNVIKMIFVIKYKVDWVWKWIKDESLLFVIWLVVFVVVEGVFFSGVFVFIFWLKKWGFMFGFMFFNELIFCDEGFYCEFVVLLFGYFNNCL